MKLFSYLIVFVLSILFFVSCSGNKELAKTDKGDMPEWFLKPPVSSDYLYATSTAASRDMQLALDKAATDARAEIARQIELKTEGLYKQFSEEIGAGDNPTLLQQYTSATKLVISETLTGSRVKEREIFKDGNNWRAYVLVEYPIGELNTSLVKQIRKQDELYTRFRSSETFKELDEEVKKLESQKNK